MVSLQEASERSKIHVSVLQRLVADGRLRFTRESPRKTRVPIGEVAAAYAAHRAAIDSSLKGGAVVKAKKEETAMLAKHERGEKPQKMRRAAPPPKKPKKARVRIEVCDPVQERVGSAIVVYESPQAIAKLVRANVAARLMTTEQALAALLDRFDPPA